LGGQAVRLLLLVTLWLRVAVVEELIGLEVEVQVDIEQVQHL
jgi:hypothetical protein